ncbi:hypothetical protein [Streptomyces mesophilus]|uniref:hypothetical protein n=1 Tax=Streptomyces mesophilus TaxID=1775132 RepID=UPI001F22299A|nr:hypothetical protein [Streptomyces mesophilus]
MSTPETSRFVRLRVELVLEVTDEDSLAGAALDRIGEDAYMPEEERTHAESAVREEAAEALAYLVDPFDLVAEVPGVELTQASWSSEAVDHDPDDPEWDEEDLDGDLAYEDEDGELPYDEDEDEGDDDELHHGEDDLAYGEEEAAYGAEEPEGFEELEEGEGDEDHTRAHGAAPVGA